MKTALLILLGALHAGAATYRVYDHASVNGWSNIPSWKLSYLASNSWRVSIPGESHAHAYRHGMQMLSTNVGYGVLTNELTIPDAPTTVVRVDGAFFGRQGATSGTNSWQKGAGEEDWYAGIGWSNPNSNSGWVISNGLAHANAAATSAVRLIGFGWCWDTTWHNNPASQTNGTYDCRWAGSSVGGIDGDLPWGLTDADYVLTTNHVCMSNYVSLTKAYQDFCTVQGWDTTVIFTTGPVDGNGDSENGWQRHVKYEFIRQWVTNNGGILLDYADILSWDEGLQKYQTNSWTSGTGQTHKWPAIHNFAFTNLDGTYKDGTVYDSSHIGEHGCVRLAKAMWVLLSDLISPTNGPSTARRIEATRLTVNRVSISPP